MVFQLVILQTHNFSKRAPKAGHTKSAETSVVDSRHQSRNR